MERRASAPFIAATLSLLLAAITTLSSSLLADQYYESSLKRGVASRRNPAFAVPTKMRPRVDFWINIFAKYGKYQAVIHHRTFPHITFEVLDFSDKAKTMSESKLDRHRAAVYNKRKAAITKALKHLAARRAPRNDLERNIQSEMSILGRGTSKYKKVINEKLIRSQRGIREKYIDAVKRSGRYMHLLEEVFVKEYKLPIELTRLPFVESSFNYKAYSSVGAAGIWQFMPRTATAYSMKINRYVDERRDVLSATRGAAKYLRGAYKTLGTWPLALTSYNHGVGGVSKKVKRLGTRDITAIIETQKKQLFGFASQNFYPEFLAALEIYDNLEKYFPNVRPEPPVYLVTKKLNNSVSIRALSQKLGVDIETLKSVNYALSRNVWSGRYMVPKGYVLKLPRTNRTQLANLRLPPPPKQETASSVYGGVVYRVRRGDTLSRIAKKYKTSVSKLRAYNNLRSDMLRIGQSLVVRPREDRQEKQPLPNSNQYLVQRGDSLYSIARRYGMTASKLRAINGLRSSRIYVGQVLKLSTSNSSKSASSNTVGKQSVEQPLYHTVRRGDSLWSISTRYGTSVSKLKQRNSLRSSKLKIGQRLRVH